MKTPGQKYKGYYILYSSGIHNTYGLGTHWHITVSISDSYSGSIKTFYSDSKTRAIKKAKKWIDKKKTYTIGKRTRKFIE